MLDEISGEHAQSFCGVAIRNASATSVAAQAIGKVIAQRNVPTDDAAEGSNE
jgi:hypothetical protein